ncbi:MAG: hypothetical protein EOM40_08780 [Clostridia bacterium]|nr:hypothetical protein [Clostridia bacterium]
MKRKEPVNNPEVKKRHKKRKLIWLIVILLFIASIVSAYLYYVTVYRVKHEPESTSNQTVTDEVYTLKSRRTLLTLTPEVKEAAFNGRAAEIDYGTYIVPGLNGTESLVFGDKGTGSICTSMTPQGLAVTEDYLLVSAYCHSSTHNSVIYMIDKKTHEFIKEIVLRNKSHVGGLAYDSVHHNLWVAGMSRGIPQVNAITLNQLEDYSFQDEYLPVTYSQSYDLYAISRSSFLTYYDNALYVGYFTEKTASVMEEYDILEDGTLATQTMTNSLDVTDSITPIALPSDMRVITEQAQGVAFYKDKLLFSRSYGVLPSALEVYNNSMQKLLETDAMLKSIRFPEKLEQIYVDGDDLYVVFESAAYGYRASSLMKIDRILKLNLKTLLP